MLDDVISRMSRASEALDVVRAVGELEHAAQMVTNAEDANTVLAHANVIAKHTARASLHQRLGAVRAQMDHKLKGVR